MRRPERRRVKRDLPRTAVLASAALHAVAGVLFVAASASLVPPLPAQTYRVRLVAAADERAPERIDPKPAAVAEEENRPPPPQPTPRRKPETKKPTVVEEKTPVPEPSKEPARSPEEGEEAVNVQLDGATFAYPEYLQNIIRQVYRYWRRPAGARTLRAEVWFVIERDGSVSDIGWIRRSGDVTFDLEARGAVEAAGRTRAFGPLPETYPRERLRVNFFFDPAST
ncbi:MAG: TonB C-terminal domain-containing protein [Gemmatimonadota bacterium]